MVKRRPRDNEVQLDELGSDSGQVGSDSAGQSGDTQGSRKSQMLRTTASKNLPILIKHTRRRPSAASRVLMTTLRGLCAPVRIVPGQMTFLWRADNSGRGRRGKRHFLRA